ncbi:hypothetical protein KIPB_011092, partial [Kipferlia bialata]
GAQRMATASEYQQGQRANFMSCMYDAQPVSKSRFAMKSKMMKR